MPNIIFYQCKNKEFRELSVAENSKIALPPLEANSLDCIIPEKILMMSFDIMSDGTPPSSFEEFKVELIRYLAQAGYSEGV